MNPDTGEVRRLRRGEEMPEGFDPFLDAKLAALAKIKVGYREATQQVKVNLRSDHPLSQWSREQRKAKKRKAKIAAASRRRNRGSK